jgi:OOP family OmpA-OmpF porin
MKISNAQKITLTATILALVFAAALTYSPRARAGDYLTSGGGIDMRLFRPAVDSKGLFTVNASPILPHLGLSFGLVIDYANGIFRLKDDPGNDLVSDGTFIIEHAGWGTLHFNLGLFNWIALGFQLPVGILSGEPIETTQSPTNDAPYGGIKGDEGIGFQGLGNVSIHVKARFLRVEMAPVGLGAILQYHAPSVYAEQHKGIGGDAVSALTAIFILDKMFGRKVKLAFNLGAHLPFGCSGDNCKITNLPRGSDRSDFKYGYSLLWGLGLSVVPLVGTLEILFEYYGHMIFEGFSQNDKMLHVPMELAFGLKVFVERNSYLYFGAATGAFAVDSVGYDASRFRIFAAFIFEPSIGDRDGDGIKDDVDQCPDDPEDQDGFEDVDGCPDPDNDRDGILDVEDDCPLVPEDKDNFEDKNGCPDLDNDNDRILDVDDSCPLDPETYNGFEDEDGCPDQGKVQIKGSEIVIMEKVYFETDSAEIKPESYGILDAVAATVIGNPQIVKVQVQGHADERASNEYNIQLTHERAASVVKYLVDKGVDSARLSSAGYGEECPVDKGHNAKAWEKNRRVEFKILETTDGCTNVQIACDKAISLGLIPAEDEKYMPGGGYCQ